MSGIRLLLDTAETVGEPRSGAKRFWTGREELILRNTYPEGGVPACLPRLPGRTPASIYQRAAKLGLIAPAEAARGAPRRRHQSNEHIDALIRRTYANPEKGAIKRLAQTIGRPRAWIADRAIKLGCTVPRFKALPWTNPEREIVRENAHRHPATICKVLKRSGFSRTETAVSVQIKRLGACTEDPNHYTATGLASLFGVDGHVITAWIGKGWLQAARRGTERVAAQGGDQWWIHRRSVRAFVIQNVGAVDFRKVDKFWLVDLLAGSVA